ncbi:unnamed protein product [Lota lota]
MASDPKRDRVPSRRPNQSLTGQMFGGSCTHAAMYDWERFSSEAEEEEEEEDPRLSSKQKETSGERRGVERLKGVLAICRGRPHGALGIISHLARIPVIIRQGAGLASLAPW